MENYKYKFGINVAFPPKRMDIVEYYKKIFNLMNKNNIYICRIWLCDFSFNYYNFSGKEYQLNVEELRKIVKLGELKNIKFIPVLFDFNEFSTTNINWDDYEHTFNTSFISNFVKRPIDFFDLINIELGFSKFLGLRNIFNDNNVFAWELFNEVDQTKGFEQKIIFDWSKKYSEKINKLSMRPIYISIGNPSLMKNLKNLFPENFISLHTYQWPYSNCYKNVIFWQSKYPENWIMEFGNEKFSQDDAFISLISSFLLNNNRKVALPWFWDDIIKSKAFENFCKFAEFIDQFIGANDKFEFTGRLGEVKKSFNSKKIKSSLKLVGVRNTFIKLATLTKILMKNASTNEELKFENKNTIILIASNSLDNYSDICNYKMINKIDFGTIRVVVFKK